MYNYLKSRHISVTQYDLAPKHLDHTEHEQRNYKTIQ